MNVGVLIIVAICSLIGLAFAAAWLDKLWNTMLRIFWW